MKKTNLGACKLVAQWMLELKPEPCEDIPVFLIHPFITSTMQPVEIDDQMQFIDVTKSEENLDLVRKRYEQLINEANDVWNLYILLHKPYRTLFFKMIEEHLSLKDYNEMLKESWVCTENPNQDVNVSLKEWKEFFLKADRRLLMNDNEYKIYRNLSNNKPVTVYRGVGINRNPSGFSWTTDYSMAEWFAKRWGENEDIYILKGECNKKDVLAYFEAESEYVIDPKDMNKIERINIYESNEEK